MEDAMDETDVPVADAKARAQKKLERDMGPVLLAALHDARTVELLLNADGRLWQETLGQPTPRSSRAPPSPPSNPRAIAMLMASTVAARPISSDWRVP